MRKLTTAEHERQIKNTAIQMTGLLIFIIATTLSGTSCKQNPPNYKSGLVNLYVKYMHERDSLTFKKAELMRKALVISDESGRIDDRGHAIYWLYIDSVNTINIQIMKATGKLDALQEVTDTINTHLKAYDNQR